MLDLAGGTGAVGASLRAVKKLADEALKALSPVFDEMYAATGRPSIPPERLLKATLLMALYTVRSERLLCEQLDFMGRNTQVWICPRRSASRMRTRDPVVRASAPTSAARDRPANSVWSL